MIGEQVMTIGGHEVKLIVTETSDTQDGWTAEAQLSEAPLFTSGAYVTWGERAGFVSEVRAETALIDVTCGPDWHVPARWEASKWREYVPGRTEHSIKITGTRA